MAELYSSRIIAPVFDSEHVLSEETNSKRNIVVESGAGVLPAGAVIAERTATGEYTWYDNGGTGGLENAAGVLRSAVDATSADRGGVINEFDTEFKLELLDWNGQAQPAIDAGIADMRVNGNQFR